MLSVSDWGGQDSKGWLGDGGVEGERVRGGELMLIINMGLSNGVLIQCSCSIQVIGHSLIFF